MLFSIFFFILIMVCFYYEKHTFLLFISMMLLFYSLFLYNCFYDNRIICNWLEKHDIKTNEEITFSNIPEFEYNLIISTGLIIVAVLFLVYFFILRMFLS